MTITLEVPPELAAGFERAARLQGRDVPTFILESARRYLRPDVLSESESRLFETINKPVPADTRRELDALIATQDERALSDDERQRLVELIDIVEMINAERWRCIGELAQLRGLSLTEMAAKLEIPIR